jgi:hypothetical protein
MEVKPGSILASIFTYFKKAFDSGVNVLNTTKKKIFTLIKMCLTKVLICKDLSDILYSENGVKRGKTL